MNVLFLSVSAGGGHLKAAEAIKESLVQKYPSSKSLIIDTLKYVNPIVDKLIIGGYLNAVKKTPQIYGMLYDIAESGKNMNDLSNKINKFLSFKIKRLINDFKPSVIVCTHPFPVQMLSSLKKKGTVNVPIVAVVTDFAVHPLWTFDCIDAYVIAHENLKTEAVVRGFPENIVHTYGIPVSNEFLVKKDKGEILKSLKLENKPTILLMGGSLGFGEVKSVFLSLLSSEKDIQIIAITGQNNKLKKQLEKCTEKTNKSVRILSYTDKVADIMDICDFIITKPGGMTVAEALVKGIPIIITSPIPGQEERNASFLTNNGAAVRIFGNVDIGSFLNQMIDNPDKISEMKENAKRLAKPDSSHNIVGLLEELVSP